jgi:hypothetical protein
VLAAAQEGTSLDGGFCSIPEFWDFRIQKKLEQKDIKKQFITAS